MAVIVAVVIASSRLLTHPHSGYAYGDDALLQSAYVVTTLLTLLSVAATATLTLVTATALPALLIMSAMLAPIANADSVCECVTL